MPTCHKGSADDNRRMKMGFKIFTTMISTMACMFTAVTAAEPVVEVRDGEKVIFSWQAAPRNVTIDGKDVGFSAFVAELRTPSGFACTNTQPADHLHHCGIWWPWKFVQVDGAKYNTWEVQQGQGEHAARGVKVLSQNADRHEWEFSNETVVQKKDGGAMPVIHETARVSLTKGKDANTLDISLLQKAVDQPVTIMTNHYSGFSLRGPAAWDKDNSVMTSSEGKGRDDANGTPARWLIVSGEGPDGPVSILILSAAAKQAGTPEKLRVWDSKNHKGAVFLNFNPVVKQAMPLDDAHPAVSNRKYRVIAADRLIDAETAEREWRKWIDGLKN